MGWVWPMGCSLLALLQTMGVVQRTFESFKYEKQSWF